MINLYEKYKSLYNDYVNLFDNNLNIDDINKIIYIFIINMEIGEILNEYERYMKRAIKYKKILEEFREKEYNTKSETAPLTEYILDSIHNPSLKYSRSTKINVIKRMNEIGYNSIYENMTNNLIYNSFNTPKHLITGHINDNFYKLYILKNMPLTEDAIDILDKEFGWQLLSRYIRFNEKQLIKYSNKILWNIGIQYQILTENIIIKLKKIFLVNRRYLILILEYQILNDEFYIYIKNILNDLNKDDNLSVYK